MNQDNLPIDLYNAKFVAVKNDEPVGRHCPVKKSYPNWRESMLVQQGPVEIQVVDKETQKNN
jgi:hypothetical protein